MTIVNLLESIPEKLLRSNGVHLILATATNSSKLDMI